MSDVSFTGDAPASAEPSGAPVDAEAPTTPQPLGSQTPVAEKPAEPVKEAPSKSAAEAVRRATETLKAKEAEKAKAEPKVDQKPAETKAQTKDPKAEAPKPDPQPRGEAGKFASKDPAAAAQQPQDGQQPVAKPQQAADPASPHREPPARFSPDAKQAWETAPEPVRAEVHRAIRELEQGHQKYKADADAYEQVRQFDEIARKNGGNLKASLERVVEIETAFQRNPLEGFHKVADHFGLPLRQVAAHIMGQKPEQVQQQNDSTVAALKQKIAQLEQAVGGVTQTIQQQRETEAQGRVQAFAKDHPRFDELADDIKLFLTSGKTNDLQEAYELAERLNPAPVRASEPAPAEPAAPVPAPLNPAGQKSVSGAPSAGSDPTGRKPAPASSTREAVLRAMKRTG